MTSTTPCLDAETLAAWADGGLDPQAAAMAEAHVSSCDRCQEIVGLMAHVATDPGSRLSDPAPAWWQRFRAGWLIPLTAGVAAVGLWMMVPANRPASPPPTAPVVASKARDEAPATQAAPAQTFAEPARDRADKRQQAAAPSIDQLARNVGKPDASSEKKEQKLAAREPARQDRFEERGAPARPAAEAAAAAPAAPAPAPAAPALGRLNAFAPSREIASPDPRTRWRLLDGGNVEYTSNSGQTWEATATGVTEPLTAGSSPTADICWIVGRNGTVLLTTDGRRWQRVAFPETTDLSSVQATDSRSALVVAADGMLFRTNDGGTTWSRP